MSRALRITTEPTTQPVSDADMELWLRTDAGVNAVDQPLIHQLIIAARKRIEGIQSRALATQTVQLEHFLDKPLGGKLSGPIEQPINWYEFQEQLGANPFGATAFYFDLPMSPVQSITTVEYMITVFDAAWTPWPALNANNQANYVLDQTKEPARLFMNTPVTALRWRFTYQAGYEGVNFIIPDDTIALLKRMVAFMYDNRDAAIPDELLLEATGRRNSWL